ncbi:MaoC family dehydratase N-terminal domain-containing protein [Aquihabitans sp. G128]|uniref:MaoC/PaaZ C-terminal domain-containing protein n=1 Tax=Aquihabitans sp. G128 TaxID=2849779 RepID=UPI001C245026|nr:MaoC/PaaZ C-terminal domain-containing protein [Aquihabitans sp. G128]QXC61507.1 MaoC family dehydratase N-terminal domain-containing protein [Aquihabitans sp. G128]
MPINPEAVGSKGQPTKHAWDSKDAILYALGVGAGSADPLQELAFTTENTQDVDQRVLPTMAVVLAVGGASAFGSIGSFNPAMLVHGEQAITLHGPIPVTGEVETTGEITGIYDKGKGAVIEVTSTSVDTSTGQPLFSSVMSAFIRGEGGFGGDRGPSGPKNVAPEREPDHTVTYQTRSDQALLYRLSGDRNPLHSDPAFAAFGGFDRPILHGLCSYGFTGRALLHALCGSDPARFTGMEARFSSPVLPGEALTVKAWETGSGEAIFQTTGDDGRTVIDAGKLTYAP